MVKKNPTRKKTLPDEPLEGRSRHKKNAVFPIVAIGASAGGLEAMSELLKNLRPDTGMSFIYVQHLSPDHRSLLTSLLAKETSMKVKEAANMDVIEPNKVLIIPPDKEMNIADGHITLKPRPKPPVVNLPIDILFSSLAEAHKQNVIGVILSGSAADGTRGVMAIKHKGGLTFAQDETAKFGSMPKSAITSGGVDFILSPKEIALELNRISKHPFVKNRTKINENDLIADDDPDLKTIVHLLLTGTGVDFSEYKLPTIKRRIIRRMLLYKMKSLKDYSELLAEKPEEVKILYQDLLINVTSFFRDTESHQYLKTTLFPKILKGKKKGEHMRIWIAACSTGEEAYSIAMALLEIQDRTLVKVPIKIFATDLSVTAIGKARVGIYTKQELSSVSPKRLQRFFAPTDGDYRIAKNVREMCVFAPHNVLSDPPFSRIDFISCCNLFIYFDSTAQQKALSSFYYALNDDGYLMLGKSETIGASTSLFSLVNKKYKIYLRKKNSNARPLPSLTRRALQESGGDATNDTASRAAYSRQKVASANQQLDEAIDSVLISEFMPPSVVVTREMEILQFRGSTDLYLTHAPGKATLNILKLVRPEIAFDLRTAISKVIKTKRRARCSDIEMNAQDKTRIVSFDVIPLKMDTDELLLLIVFDEHEQSERYPKQSGDKDANSANTRKLKKLEAALAAARADALAFVREHEAYTEDLQRANEEVISSNEELQTVNEELETSKEEIESANEELITTNQELQTRNELLNESYEYIEAVIATIHEPMLVLDKNLRIKSASLSFYKFFGSKPGETEGVLLYDLGYKQWDIPALRELLSDIVSKDTRLYNFEVTHTFPNIGTKTMLLNASRIVQKAHHEQLILLAIADVTENRNAALRIQASEERFRAIFNQARAGVAQIDLQGNLNIANQRLCNILGYEEKELIGKPIEGFLHPDEQSRYAKLLESLVKAGEGFDAEQRYICKDKDIVWLHNSTTALYNSDNSVQSILSVFVDVTRQKEAEQHKDEFIGIASHELKTPLTSIKSYSELLHDKLKVGDYIQVENIASKLNGQVDRMLSLIKALLDTTLITSGEFKINKSPFDLLSVINEVAEAMQRTTQKHTLELQLNAIPTFTGDKGQIEQVLTNLIDNAIKYSPNGGRIIISCSSENNMINICVQDFGNGISAQTVKNIFNRFYRGEERSSGNSFGLGLYISMEIARLHGGTIEVESHKGQGTKFCLNLPLNES